MSDFCPHQAFTPKKLGVIIWEKWFKKKTDLYQTDTGENMIIRGYINLLIYCPFKAETFILQSYNDPKATPEPQPHVWIVYFSEENVLLVHLFCISICEQEKPKWLIIIIFRIRGRDIHAATILQQQRGGLQP